VAKETPQQLRMAGHAPALAGDRGLDVFGRVGGEVGQATVLEVAPEEFHGVEVWCVRRKPDDVAAPMSREPGPHEFVLVGAPAVPEQDEGPAHMAGEMAKKPHHLGPSNVALRMQRQRQGDAPAPGRHDQGANTGDLLVRPRSHGQRRGHPARRPRPAEHRQHQEPRFIQAHEVSAEPVQFFLPWPNQSEPIRARDDRRALSRAVGVAAD